MNVTALPASAASHPALRVFLAALLGGAAACLLFLSYGGHSYAVWQVGGAILTLGVVTVASRVAAHGRAFWATPAGATLGFWGAWTGMAAAYDETGLFLVGAVLLLAGLIPSTLLAAAVTERVLRSRRRHG